MKSSKPRGKRRPRFAPPPPIPAWVDQEIQGLLRRRLIAEGPADIEMFHSNFCAVNLGNPCDCEPITTIATMTGAFALFEDKPARRVQTH